MKPFKQMRCLFAAGAVFALVCGTGTVFAQDRPGRGNFDPEQMRTRMMERYREALEVKSDDEWKLIEGRINKVVDARRDVGIGGFGRGFGGGGRGGGRGGGDGNDGGENRRARFFGGEPSAEAQELQKAIEAKAPNDEIKAKLAKYRDSQKDKRDKLEKAQDDLRKVLSVRQEANAVLMGLLQ
jgi:hypothetical protein